MTKHILKIAFFVTLGVTAVTFLTMFLWNFIVPGIFNGPEITFAQTLGILLLSRILFGGWKKSWHHHAYCGPRHHRWRHKMEERWNSMTNEEKEKFKSKFAHCGWSPSAQN